MPSMSSIWESPVGVRLALLLSRLKSLELLDRCYTLAAQSLVAMLPLVMVLAALLTSEGEESVVAEDLIARLGLVGAGAAAMRELIVINQYGVYWIGALIVLYSAFSLSRRVGRAYNAVWGCAPLPASQQWRGLVWLALQVVMIIAVTQLRSGLRDVGTWAAAAVATLLLLTWFVGEAAAQWLLTRGAVARGRLLLASGFVTAGRLGVAIWGVFYLDTSLSRQAESYGPIGVVFGLFTAIFATWGVILGGTLLAAALTEPLDPPEAPGGPASAQAGRLGV